MESLISLYIGSSWSGVGSGKEARGYILWLLKWEGKVTSPWWVGELGDWVEVQVPIALYPLSP